MFQRLKHIKKMTSHNEKKISNEHPIHGDVNHSSTLCEDIGAMHLSDDYSDVTLIVCGQRFNSHKNILAARSKYFRALLSGGFKESTRQEIELKDANLSGFKGLLEYIYAGKLSLKDKPEKVLLDILVLAQVYRFSKLGTCISAYLNGILSIENVCLVFNAALLHQIELLIRACHEYMDENACEIMKHESFLKLSPDALYNLVSRDSFYAPEIDIFLAVQSWLKANPDAHGKTILGKVRLSLISTTDLSNVVCDTGLVSVETILNAVRARKQKHDSDLKYRGRLFIDVNVASASHGAQVLDGDLVVGDSTNNVITHKFSTDGILIKLQNQYIINHFKMSLSDKDVYSYYVEVSTDQRYWVRVIDYTKYRCILSQYLYFKPRAVRYIRIVGTNATTIDKEFHLLSFEAYYRNHSEKLSNGFVVPTRNVATIDEGAIVMTDYCSSPKYLLNGDTSNYDWEKGYTSNKIGSGYILIKLRQPYIIDSMRLLLWDLDDESYSYYIEVSGDSSNWVIIADKTKEACRSWQTIRFEPPRPVVYIRITGTHSTKFDEFRCVHFECPAQINDEVTSKSTVQKEERSESDESVPCRLPPPPKTAGEADNIDLQDTSSTDSYDLLNN